MKRIKIISVLFILFINVTVNSQTIEKEINFSLFAGGDTGGKFSLENVKLNSDGDLIIEAFTQRKATIDNTKMLKVLKEGYYPAVQIIRFDNNLNKKDVILESINLNSLGIVSTNYDYILTEKGLGEIGNQKKDKTYDKLQSQYPDVILPAGAGGDVTEYFIDMERTLKKREYKKQFDLISNTFLIINNKNAPVKSKSDILAKNVSLQYPETELIRKKFGYGMANDKKNRFIFVSGLYYDKKERKADNTKKFNEFRQYIFDIFDENGKLINTYSKNFEYPKSIKFNSPVYTNNKFKGFLYILGYGPGGKKFNNNETADKYWAIYFNENGELIFDKEFQSKDNTIFISASENKEELNILVQGNEYLPGLIKLSSSDYKQVSFKISDLKEKTKNGNYEKGFYRPFTSYYPVVRYINKTGTVVFFLQKETVISKTDNQGKVTKTTKYSYSSLVFNKDGEFICQLIIPNKSESSAGRKKYFKVIDFTENKLVFAAEESIGKYSPKSFSRFVTSENNLVTKNNIKQKKSVFIGVIDLKNSELKTTNVSNEPFILLTDKGKYFAIDNNNNCIYLVGIDKDFTNLKISKIHY